ncbi:tRNA(Ile)-lysidine synthase [Pasteurella testudinis DSM 23072]|uniref:tRNA(Ile)-lysidine synthase n=1 Tax=Pasteurella testudinis DSM 23072 TaxID=1122938 RepID=A0A1W1UP36_9PAST|nr:tRNA lysidine(34) synthetase TilS [Pasteurella testudinis]SMB82888.1 tRNA(Ile)-lysidine synthase [Pasteurella testudinis DSM 23072]SUB51522.1 tRNA(Ile)-lysidine synthase [Pasteurella testudinis]
MFDFLAQLHRTLLQQQISQASFLLAYSGGLDSSALLSLFARLKQQLPQLKLRAIHVHHGLSPHADHWAQHCRRQCQRYDIPLIVEKVRLSNQKGIEDAARSARYYAFKQHLKPHEILVTAHHLNDQSETLLLALKRGSGIKGLAAMQVRSELWQIPIFRPLLDYSRDQLLDYAQTEGLSWIEDESNQDNRYDRNFLRNHILPPLRERWPQIDRTLQRSAQHCFEQYQLLQELLLPVFEQHYCATDRTLNISGFTKYSRHKQAFLLRLWLEKNALAMPSQRQLSQLIEQVISAAQGKQPQLRLENSIIRRYQQRLYLTPNYADISRQIIKVVFEQEIPLPDNLGNLFFQLKTTHIVVIWQKTSGTVKHTLPLPNRDQSIQIRFHYSGKVRLARNRANTDIKKVWQHFAIPPWQRSRIPLVFYAENLICALGAFVAAGK